MTAKGKSIYPNLRWPPIIKYLLRRNVLLYHTLCTHSMPDSIYLHQISVSVTIFTVTAFMFLTLTPHISILFTAIPHLIISLIHYIGRLQSLLVRCAAMPLWSTLTKYYIYVSWFINLLEPIKIHSFLHRWN